MLRGHEGAVRSVTFSHDGQALMSGSRDETVRLWPVRKPGAPVTRLNFTNGVSAAGFLAKHRRAVSLSHKGELQLWDLDALHEAGAYQLSIDCSDVWGGSYYFFGTPFAVGNHEGWVAIWDYDNRKEIATFRAHQGRAQVVAISPDGQTLATVGQDQKIKLWRVQAQPELKFEMEEAPPFWMAFSSDGQWLVTTHENGSVAVRDAAKSAPQDAAGRSQGDGGRNGIFTRRPLARNDRVGRHGKSVGPRFAATRHDLDRPTARPQLRCLLAR